MPVERFTPLYRWLAETLREEIQHGVYKPGDLLPSERELVQRYGLSSITVTRALNELVREGWLYRKAGKGTFLKRDRLEERLGRLTSFAEEMRQRNIIPQYKLLRAQAVIPPSDIARALRLEPSARAFFIERLHLAKNEPIALARGYWIIEIGEQLAQRDLNRIPLYETTERELHIPLVEADESISAAVADAELARHLGVPRRSPLLVQERLTFTTEMRPVHFTTTYFRADRYKYKIRLSR
jgi:GntR family transcriptional regulator